MAPSRPTLSFRQRITWLLHSAPARKAGQAGRWALFKLRNRYVRVAVFAAIWMLFFDRYDIRTLVSLRAKVSQLESDKTYYQAAIRQLRTERALFEENLQEVERIAREQYLMKRPDEDVFIITKAE
jgi:cell division protein DivIC